MSRRLREEAQLAAAEMKLAAARAEEARLQRELCDRRKALYNSRSVVRGHAAREEVATETRVIAGIERQLAAVMTQLRRYEEEELHRHRVIVVSARDLNAAVAARNARIHLDQKKIPTPVERTTKWLQIVELFVSARIAREEIGDVLEVIHRYEREGRPRWHIYVRAVTGALLALWHTWGDKLAALKRIGG